MVTDGHTDAVAAAIRVSDELRDRINREAQERRLTAAGLIQNLLDGDERRRRMESFGRAFRDADDAYRCELRLWEVTFGDSRIGG